MANKKDLTTEELKKLYEDALEKSNTLGEMLRQKEKEEKEIREAKLALEKESRKEEVDDAFNNYKTLLSAYIKDYGSFTVTNPNDDFFKSLFDQSWPWWL